MSHPMRRFLVFLLIILQPVFLSAQKNCIRSSAGISYVVKYQKNNDFRSGYGNHLLREIAKHVLEEPWKVNLHFNFVLDVGMDCRKGDNNLMVSLKAPAMAGDIHYRQFDVSDVLAPSRMDFILRRASRLDSSSFSEQRLSFPGIDLRDSLLLAISVGNFDPDFDTLVLREMEFSYDSLSYALYIQRLRLIDDYYASLLLLDSIQTIFDTLNIANLAGLPILYIQVEEINKTIERIEARGFLQNLSLGGQDPLNLVERYQNAYKAAQSLTFNYRDALMDSVSIPWDGDVGVPSDFFVRRVISFIVKSQWMDDLRGDIYKDCLDHCFDGSTFPEGDAIPETLLRKMYPNADGDTLLPFVAKAVLASYRQFAQRLMAENRFAEAVILLENAEKFAAAIPAVPYLSCRDTLFVYASTEVFNAFTGIASGCILNRQYPMADDYLEKAAQYQRCRPGLITDDSVYRRVYGELFFMRNVQCDRLLDQGSFEAAFDCYRQFEQTYPPEELAPVTGQLNEKKERALVGMCMMALSATSQALGQNQPDSALRCFDQATTVYNRLQDVSALQPKYDSLAPVVNHIKYATLFSEGVMALNQRKFTQALQNFDQALLLSKKYAYIQDPAFDSLYRRAMKNRLLIDLGMAQREIWASRFDSAEAMMDRIREKGRRYGVSGDPDFIYDMALFRQKMMEQQCRNLNDSVNYRMVRADRNVALKNFSQAGILLQDALSTANTVPGCKLCVESIVDSINKYGKAIAYHQNLDNAGKWAASGGYDKALALLWENEQISRDHNLSRLGCEPVSLFEFVSSSNNPYLILQAAYFYQARGDDRTAYRFLRLLRSEDFQISETRDIQEKLAKTLAQRDYTVATVDYFKTKEPPDLPEEKWLRFFRATYLKEWDRLLRNSPPAL